MTDTDTITGLFAGIPELIKAVPGLVNRIPQAAKAVGSKLWEAAPGLALGPAIAMGDRDAFALAAALQERKKRTHENEAQRLAYENIAHEHGLLAPDQHLAPGDAAQAFDLSTKLYGLEHPKPQVFKTDQGLVRVTPNGAPPSLILDEQGKPLGAKIPNAPKVARTAAGAWAEYYANPTPDNKRIAESLTKFEREQAGAVAGAAAGARRRAEDDAVSPVPTLVKPGVEGNDVLAHLPPNEAEIVRGLIEYRIPLPSGFALQKPAWQRLLSLAAQADPTFDASLYSTRQGVRRDFTSGQTAKAVQSANTVIGHLDTLKRAAAELGNTWSPSYNTVKNYINSGLGKKAIKNFKVARNAVATELTRVFRGTGGAEADIKDWQGIIDASDSPEQLQGAINQALDLLDSRIEAIQDNYYRGMGKPMDIGKLLSPKAREMLDRLHGSARMAGTPTVDDIFNQVAP